MRATVAEGGGQRGISSCTTAAFGTDPLNGTAKSCYLIP
jgi:hypothetical protein